MAVVTLIECFCSSHFCMYNYIYAFLFLLYGFCFYGYCLLCFVAIFSKDAVAILHFLVAMARHFGCRHELPLNVSVRRIYFKQLEKKLETKLYEEAITGDDTSPT